MNGELTHEAKKRLRTIQYEETERLFKDPRWPKAAAVQASKMQHIPDPADRLREAERLLADRGTARLSATELDQWFEVRHRLAQTSLRVCAGLWTGELPNADWDWALTQVSEADLRAYTRLRTEGTLRELSASKPLEPDPEGVQLGALALAETLHPNEAKRFIDVWNYKLDSDADHCFGTKVFHARSPRLPPELRERFFRAFAINMAER